MGGLGDDRVPMMMCRYIEAIVFKSSRCKQSCARRRGIPRPWAYRIPTLSFGDNRLTQEHEILPSHHGIFDCDDFFDESGR